MAGMGAGLARSEVKARKRAASSSLVMRAGLLILLSSFVFLSGMIIGVLYFDQHAPAQRPWEGVSSGTSPSRGLAGIPLAVQPEEPVASPPPALHDLDVAVAASTPTASPAPPAAPTVVVPVRQHLRASPVAPPALPPRPKPYTGQAPDSFASFSGDNYFLARSGGDGPEVTVAAWIRPRLVVPEAGVVLANRASGCAPVGRTGFALMVNSPRNGDMRLVLQWGSDVDGCHTLASEANALVADEWVNVAFSLSGGESTEGVAQLFINAAPMASVRIPAGQRRVQILSPLRIGSFVDGASGFYGDIAHVLVFKRAMALPQLEYAIGHVTAEKVKEYGELASPVLEEIILLPPGPARQGGAAMVGQSRGGPPAQTIQRPYKHQPPEAEPPRADPPTQAAGTAAPPSLLSSGAGNTWLSHTIPMPVSMVTGDVSNMAALTAGTFSDEATPEALAQSDADGAVRAAAVKEAMTHAWSGYKSRAWGSDEVLPQTGERKEAWGGMGMTMIDALDTLWVMGMTQEFNEAKAWLANNLNFGHVKNPVSFFETIIRAVGGLLSAYEFSHDPVFLHKAQDVTDRLLPSFNSGARLPRSQVNMETGESSNMQWARRMTPLAEIGTLQLEFRYLSRHTGNPKYAEIANEVIATMQRHSPDSGLFPTLINPDTGMSSNRLITFGALGDSFYEYLLKTWIQGGRREDMYLQMYNKAVDSLTHSLLQRSTPSNLLYVADMDGGRLKHKMDHLACFVPGMLALGAYYSDGTVLEAKKWDHLRNAKALMYTCWQYYERMETGLSPEYMDFAGGRDPTPPRRAMYYMLRPEVAESLWILHQLTGNPIYREWGWKMFLAIERNCKLPYGYGSYPDVTAIGRPPSNKQESFFFAETLKYLYMLQSPTHSISLEKYVMNTEAHPLAIFNDADTPEPAQ